MSFERTIDTEDASSIYIEMDSPSSKNVRLTIWNFESAFLELNLKELTELIDKLNICKGHLEENKND